MKEVFEGLYIKLPNLCPEGIIGRSTNKTGFASVILGEDKRSFTFACQGDNVPVCGRCLLRGRTFSFPLDLRDFPYSSVLRLLHADSFIGDFRLEETLAILASIEVR